LRFFKAFSSLPETENERLSASKQYCNERQHKAGDFHARYFHPDASVAQDERAFSWLSH
jgi:hypothetical protein